jgi:hypothetical protein
MLCLTGQPLPHVDVPPGCSVSGKQLESTASVLPAGSRERRKRDFRAPTEADERTTR